HMDLPAVTAEVVPGEIDQHDVLRTLLRIGFKGLSNLFVLLQITGPLEGTGYWINGRFALPDGQLRFWRRAEQPKATVVEIKQIRRRIDGPECPVNVELVAQEWRGKAPGRNDLKYVAAVNMPLKL